MSVIGVLMVEIGGDQQVVKLILYYLPYDGNGQTYVRGRRRIDRDKARLSCNGNTGAVCLGSKKIIKKIVLNEESSWGHGEATERVHLRHLVIWLSDYETFSQWHLWVCGQQSWKLQFQIKIMTWSCGRRTNHCQFQHFTSSNYLFIWWSSRLTWSYDDGEEWPDHIGIFGKGGGVDKPPQVSRWRRWTCINNNWLWWWWWW